MIARLLVSAAIVPVRRFCLVWVHIVLVQRRSCSLLFLFTLHSTLKASQARAFRAQFNTPTTLQPAPPLLRPPHILLLRISRSSSYQPRKLLFDIVQELRK